MALSVVRTRLQPSKRLKGVDNENIVCPLFFIQFVVPYFTSIRSPPPPVSPSVKVCHPASFVIVLVQGVCREGRLMG